VRELPFIMPITGEKQRPHLLIHLLAAYQPIGLRLYGREGAPIGPVEGRADADELGRVRRLLTDSSRPNEVWIQAAQGKQWVRGVVRLSGQESCLPCHQAGVTLGAATMRIDLSEELGHIRSLLHRRVGLLLGAWILLVGVVATLVQLSVRRSASGLEADLAAVAAGRNEASSPAGLPLDPATAELHGRLRDFLRRQREREVEVASRLARADQLASLGQLAAGLAHEIKKPLAGMQGALEVLRDDTPDASTAGVYDEMLGELKRVNAILQRLLESGRPAPLRLAETDLARLAEETVSLLQPALRRRGVELVTNLAPDLPRIRLDASKMRQVLMNLVQNAAEAMGERGGRVTVRASALPQNENGGVVLAVEDDGPGIEGESLRRVFEPFFTTKFSGTGLGLAISKGLVEQHGGRIEVDSQVGRGTTFFVFLPASEAPELRGEVA
jgi:signal transduction histidine kinase